MWCHIKCNLETMIRMVKRVSQIDTNEAQAMWDIIYNAQQNTITETDLIFFDGCSSRDRYFMAKSRQGSAVSTPAELAQITKPHRLPPMSVFKMCCQDHQVYHCLIVMSHLFLRCHLDGVFDSQS